VTQEMKDYRRGLLLGWVLAMALACAAQLVFAQSVGNPQSGTQFVSRRYVEQLKTEGCCSGKASARRSRARR
jgi:hypothetical protein